jgi:hypothetical protein
MISLRYGTLPIVRETGGLRDTVLSYNRFTDEGNGFTFLNYNAHDMLSVIRRAIHYYQNEKEVWHQLMDRAMRGKYGWDQSALKYIALYSSLIPAHPAETATASEPEAPSPDPEPEPATATKEAETPAITSADNPAAEESRAQPADEPAKPARKPRAKKVATSPSAGEPAKPARKPRAKKQPAEE